MQTRGEEQLWGSSWNGQFELWEKQLLEEIMQTKERPPERPTAAALGSSNANQPQDSTSVPPIRVTKSTRRLIDPGEYQDALCVNASHRWNRQYERWEAIIEFVFQEPVPKGDPIPAHVRLGNNPAEPELPDHHWLFDLLLKLDRSGNIDVAALKGHYFDVSVRTIKKPRNEKVDRPPNQWYSRVSRMSLSDGFHEMAAQDALEKAERER